MCILIIDYPLCRFLKPDVLNQNLCWDMKPSRRKWRVTLYRRLFSFLREGITKCSNEVYNKFTKYTSAQQIFIGAIGYMFRSVNRSSSGLQHNKSNVLLRNWHPNILYSCKQVKNLVLDKMWCIDYLVKTIETRVGRYLCYFRCIIISFSEVAKKSLHYTNLYVPTFKAQWLLHLRLVLTFNLSSLCLRGALMRFICISEQNH